MKKYTFCFLLIAALFLAACGNDSQEMPATDPAPTEIIVPVTTAVETEPVATTLPAPTEPTETVPETQPPLQLHSGLREDGSFADGVIFIGDSQTYLFVEQYLKLNDLMGGAKSAAQCGASVLTFWDDDVRPTQDKTVYCAFSPEFTDMTFREAIASVGADATAIYIMLGSNHVPNAGSESYIAIVDWLLETCPNATVHLQTIPRGMTPYLAVNGWLEETMAHYAQLEEPRVMLVDVCSATVNHLNVDGVHVTAKGCGFWYEAIVSHAREMGLTAPAE